MQTPVTNVCNYLPSIASIPRQCQQVCYDFVNRDIYLRHCGGQRVLEIIRWSILIGQKAVFRQTRGLDNLGLGQQEHTSTAVSLYSSFLPPLLNPRRNVAHWTIASDLINSVSALKRILLLYHILGFRIVASLMV